MLGPAALQQAHPPRTPVVGPCLRDHRVIHIGEVRPEIADGLRTEIADSLRDGIEVVTIDLSDVTLLAREAAVLFWWALHSVEREGACVMVVGGQAAVDRLLELCRLATVQICPTLSGAATASAGQTLLVVLVDADSDARHAAVKLPMSIDVSDRPSSPPPAHPLAALSL